MKEVTGDCLVDPSLEFADSNLLLTTQRTDQVFLRRGVEIYYCTSGNA